MWGNGNPGHKVGVLQQRVDCFASELATDHPLASHPDASNAAGVYVRHSGVSLAAVVGRLAAEEIVDGACPALPSHSAVPTGFLNHKNSPT